MKKVIRFDIHGMVFQVSNGLMQTGVTVTTGVTKLLCRIQVSHLDDSS